MAVGVVSLKGAHKAEDVSIAVIEKARPEAKKDSPAPPPPPEAPKAAVKAKAAPKPAVAKAEAEAPPPMAGGATGADVPDFGVSLGSGSAGGGLAVPGGPRAESAPAARTQVSKKLLAAPAPTPRDACTEAPVKPKVISISQPAYTQEARDANIAGKVRVELTVDATGKVASARVLEGLGHGLDDAALAAARAATFEPATRCGKAASATFVVAMRFAL
jgi:protein TonB